MLLAPIAEVAKTWIGGKVAVKTAVGVVFAASFGIQSIKNMMKK